MSDLSEERSEVAYILAQIRSEYEAAHQGLSGLAQGVSQHQFISQRTERIGKLYSQLHMFVDDEEMVMLASQIDEAIESDQKKAQEKEGQGRQHRIQ